MRYSIVIPCYNEAENIPLILTRFDGAITRDDLEVILVNNGSTDTSAAVMADLVPRYAFARVVEVPVNQGYGYGILAGLRAAKGEAIGWTHADLQTSPEDVIKAFDLMEKAEDPNCFVKGNRKGRPAFDQFFTLGMSAFESLYLGAPLWDINAQPNVFPRAFFEAWDEPPYDFALDLYALYMAKKRSLSIIRFDVAFPPRIHGASKWNTGLSAKWKFIKRTISFSRSLKRRGDIR